MTTLIRRFRLGGEGMAGAVGSQSYRATSYRRRVLLPIRPFHSLQYRYFWQVALTQE